ncbi:serine hydrolase domain-containing protein [Polaribacter porphyrae]|uniref:Beta-lactamase-related domain-containing protein n=1 Tax=Polaribacter porphyrae TaxID=1137780 RepID=A0A2S7WP91_9FLAO|nr:serine hydrolase domain-containing protein [Polaribacter porphyrae]PQJ79276.1 hypothetical protein BTO18_08865 [Polaribacter porphyrae]
MNKYNIKLVNSTIIFLIIFGFSCKSQKIATSSSKEELILNIEKIFSQASIAGFTIVVVDEKDILYQQSLGYANISSKIPYTNKTIQTIASISKTFIALALMKAVEMGKLNLDDDINKYLPFKVMHPKYPLQSITIRHLTNHTSGIIDGKIYDKSYALKNRNEDLSYLPKHIKKYVDRMSANIKIDDAQFLENMLSEKGKWYTKNSFNKKKPGSEFNYSNVGASLAAYIIELAVGLPYEKFTEEIIFNPLQMNNTGWDLNNLDVSKYAIKYFNGKGLIVPDYDLITNADGALITSSNDFSKYLQEVLKGFNGNGTLLNNTSYKEIFTKNNDKIGNSGIFWEISNKGNPNHSGGDPGILSNTVLMKDKKIGIFMMCNGVDQSKRKNIKALQNIFNTLLKYYIE